MDQNEQVKVIFSPREIRLTKKEPNTKLSKIENKYNNQISLTESTILWSLRKF